MAALGAAPEVAAPDEADRSGGGRRRRRDELPLDLAPALAHRVAVARGRGQGHEWELARQVAGERHLDLGPLLSPAAGDAVMNTDRARRVAAHPEHGGGVGHLADGHQERGLCGSRGRGQEQAENQDRARERLAHLPEVRSF